MAEQDKLAKVRALLATAEDESLSEEARAAYRGRAADLMARYGIDEALARAQGNPEERAANVWIDVEAPYALDKVELLAAVANPLGCRLLRANVRGPGERVRMLGMPGDLDRTLILYTSLLVQAELGLAVTRPPEGEDTRAFRRTWRVGFAEAIGERLAATVAKASAEADARSGGATSTELVLADRDALVQAHLNALYPKVRKGRARRLSGSGGTAGYAAGQRADIGGPNRVGPASPTRHALS